MQDDPQPTGSTSAPPATRKIAGLTAPSASTVGTMLGGLVLGLFLVWAWQDGGYARTTWLPGGLFLVALAGLTLFFAGRGLPAPPFALLALAFLAAFTLWNALTILWADSPADAWDGTNRTLLYLAVFALFVALPLRPRAVVRLFGAYALGVGLVALISVVRASVGDDPVHWYIGGRLAAPMDYSNADAALFLAAVWPALIFASRREVPPLLRGCFLGSAGVLLEVALLSQSRGSLVAVPIVAILVTAFVPGRMRFVLSGTLAGIAALLASPTLLDVYPALADDGDLASIPQSGRVVLLSAAVLFGAGALVGFVDRAVTVQPRVSRAIGAVILACALVGVLAGSAGFVARYGAPWSQVGDRWAEFKAGENAATSDQRDPHLSSGLGSNRYDLWRVGLSEFRRSPVLGVGSDNFAIPYLAERRTSEEPLYPHSLPVRLLSQTGLVGTLLFSGFLTAVGVGAWRARKRTTPFRSATRVAALAFAGYWLVHGSVDWFWEIPALGAPAFAALALSLCLAGGRRAPQPPRGAARAVIVVGAAVACLSFVAPWVAAKETELAAQRWPESPGLAFDRLRLARHLNPLSDEPDVIAAVIAQRVGDPVRERTSLIRALERSPDNWYAHLKLGLRDAAEGDVEAGLRHVATARRLNPREPVLILVEDRLRAGKPVSAEEIDRVFIARAETLVRARGRQRPAG